MQAKLEFSDAQKKLIATKLMPGAKQEDVDWFIEQCQSSGLDPFKRQIIPTSRRTKDKNDNWVLSWATLTTIDGFRSLANDTGNYAGQDGPFWCGKDGIWKDIWTEPTAPFAAKIIVFHKDFSQGLSAVAKHESYVQTFKDKNGNVKPNTIWATMGDHMIAKVAEALALRKAFPQALGGLYTTDEMAQAGYTSEAIEKDMKEEAERATGKKVEDQAEKKPEPKPEPKPEKKPEPEPKPEKKPESKPEPKPEKKPEPKPEPEKTETPEEEGKRRVDAAATGIEKFLDKQGAADANKAARLVVKEKGLDVQADPKNATKSKGEKMIALAEVLESWLMNKIEDERLANLDEGE